MTELADMESAEEGGIGIYILKLSIHTWLLKPWRLDNKRTEKIQSPSPGRSKMTVRLSSLINWSFT